MCRNDLFSQHAGGTANAVVNVPVLVEIRSRNSFYGHPIPSAVSITVAICFMQKCEHSMLMLPGTVCVDRFTDFCLLGSSIRSNCNYRVLSFVNVVIFILFTEIIYCCII